MIIQAESLAKVREFAKQAYSNMESNRSGDTDQCWVAIENLMCAVNNIADAIESGATVTPMEDSEAFQKGYERGLQAAKITLDEVRQEKQTNTEQLTSLAYESGRRKGYRKALNWAAEQVLKVGKIVSWSGAANGQKSESIHLAEIIRRGPQVDGTARARTVIFGEFVECDSCRSKPGSPLLCAGCLNNRTTISALKEAIRPQN